MSRIVNIIFDVLSEDGYDDQLTFASIEDAKTGEVLHHVGHWLDQDGLRALQLRVMHLDEHVTEGLNICPCCNREIPPPPPDLTWRRSKP